MAQQRILELDGFRAIAILLVVLFHLNFYYGHVPFLTEIIQSGGELGVTLFFFLSGFLMASPYVSYAKEGKLYSFKRFYKARFLRILPLLFFTSTLFLLLRHHNHLNEGISDMYSLGDYFGCLFLIDGRMIRLNPVLWTLRVEILFYLLYPLLGYLIYWGIVKRRMTWIYLILIALTLSSFLVFVSENREPTDFFAACHMLLLGSINRLWFVYFREDKAKRKYYTFIGSIILGLLILSIYAHLHMEQKMLGRAFITILLNAFFFITLLGKGFYNQFLSNSVFAFISLISYSIYLWHFNIHYSLSVPLSIFVFPDSILKSMFLGHCLSLCMLTLLSIISYTYIEKPFLKFKS